VKWPLTPANGDGSGWRKSSNNWRTSRARFFPLRQRKRRALTLRSEFGEITVIADYGQHPDSHVWLCPLRQQWGLSARQQLTPGFSEKLCFTVTATGSYEEAAQVACKWGGGKMDDATLHVLVQRMGSLAEAQTLARLPQPPTERSPQRPASALAVLMVDGWQVRQRGPGWGKTRTAQPRVEYHELKTGVYYLHEQSAATQSGRGLLTDKVVVSWQGEPGELGRRLHWEALRGGLGRAQQTLFLGDGAPWIWNLQQDRWGGAIGLLDFYHGSQHLWALGQTLHGEEQPALTQWVERRLHRLRHGNEKQVLGEIRRLKSRRSQAGRSQAREQNYFATHAGRMNYRSIARRGWPIGSGAVESACRQKQCRFKRSGQFWTSKGLRHLCALEEARRNHHWDQLWQPA
jgi:hypothetical protein